MKKLTYLIFALLLLSCSSKGSKEGEEDSVVVEKEEVRSLDSIEVSAFYMGDYTDEFATVELINPYNDSILLDDEYYIYDLAKDTMLLKQKHPRIVIAPESSCKFEVALGYDSIWFEQDRTYLYTFPGKTRDKDVVFYKHRFNIGYFNKKKGEWCLVVDTIYHPLLVIADSLLEDKNVQEEDAPQSDELEKTISESKKEEKMTLSLENRD